MEPRIGKLLGDSATVDRSTLDPNLLLPFPAVTPRRPPPHSDETRDDATTTQQRNDPSGREPRARQTPSRQKSSVPLAEVLNNESPSNANAVPQPTISPNPHSYAQPFSGRLQDILLDPSQERSTKRRKTDGRTTPPALGGTENAMLTLPKPPQLPKKVTRRPRIPPLLQGLHQPPPLPPESKLFPPITGDAGGFGRDIGDRVALRSPGGPERASHAGKGKEKEAEVEGTQQVGVAAPDSEPGAGKDKAPLKLRTASQENQIIENQKGGEKGASKGKETRKRNKWSDQETKDLLCGVSMFGIGNWKKILNHAEFSFNQRTAVDLKDRFRTCCPADATKHKQPRSRRKSKDNHEAVDTSSVDAPIHQSALNQASGPSSALPSKTRKTRSDQEKKSSAELVEMGIQTPFEPSKRRQRREFTEADDKNLWRGYKKHGTVWHVIRDDKDLGFSTRHPTDLRDRFRIRYPEEYAKAGYKLKPKEEQTLKEKENGTIPRIVTPTQKVDVVEKVQEIEKIPASEQTTTAPATSASKTPGIRAHALLQPLRNSYPTSLEEYPDIFSEEDGEGRHSPITLSRHIFQWADANPSQAGMTGILGTSAGMPTIASLTGDLNLNMNLGMFEGMDIMHIDPQALRLPSASMASGAFSGMQYTPVQNSSNPFQQTNFSNPTSYPSAASGPSSNLMPTTKQQTTDALLRTPNLPTIVFPQVPVASARSTMHNLPPPADLLSGLDLDIRSGQQNVGFLLDDGMSFGLAVPGHNASTLAPLVGGSGGGRGMMVPERDSREKGFFADETFGERSLLNSSI